MAQSQVTLTIANEQGRTRRVSIESNRFAIGRSPDNDLAIDDSGLSRRHALIENFDGVIQISDCGSENGSFVNGNRVAGGVLLRDGDMISIGFGCNIMVSINPVGAESAVAGVRGRNGQSGVSSIQSSGPVRRLTAPLIAAISVVILLVAVPLIAFLNREGAAGKGRAARSQERLNENKNARPQVPQRTIADRVIDADIDAPSTAITIERVEEAAVQFMRRISSDDKPYVFPPYAVSALGDIKQRVEQYCAGTGLARTLNSIANGGPAIAAQARREGIEPGLVIYVALAETDRAGVVGDQMATARRILPDLLSLRKTLGTESADKSLILVAAYKMGGGTKKSHPLLRTMTRVVKNPLTDRNVWYLHEHGGLDAQAYDFVVSFLALGVIAENPRKFGVTAPPLAY